MLKTPIQCIRFPNFGTYVPPEIHEEHNDDPLTEEEIKALAVAELAFRKEEKERKAL